MREFKKIYKFIHKFEAYYVNDPLDSGGETICGIARKYHKDWEGWEFIDSLTSKGLSINEINKIVQENEHFTDKIVKFYYNKYYKRYGYDRFGFSLGLVITDGTVLFGFKRISKNLQKIINNNLPQNEHIKVDGYVGKKSYKALDKVLNLVSEKEIALSLLMERVDDIMETIRYKPKNKRFLNGWLNRTLSLYNLIKKE